MSAWKSGVCVGAVRRMVLKPFKNRPVRNAFRLMPEATSHFLALSVTAGMDVSRCHWTSLDTYWNVLTSLSMPSLFARKTASFSAVSVLFMARGEFLVWIGVTDGWKR